MVALFHLHGVAQSAGGTGDNGDFLHGRGVRLLCGHKSVSDLMISDDTLLLVCQNGVFLLVAGNDHLNTLLQVRLGGKASAVAYCPEGCLVDDISKLRAGSAGGHAGHFPKVHIVGDLHLSGMYLQDLLPALQVGQLHGHAPVEAAGTGKGRVQGFRAVGGGKDDHAAVALKAVHFRKELVQGLLPLVVAAQLTIALFADSVDLVDKHDAGRLFLGLFKQVADLACAHTDEHLDKVRPADAEKRCGYQGLAGGTGAQQPEHHPDLYPSG